MRGVVGQQDLERRPGGAGIGFGQVPILGKVHAGTPVFHPYHRQLLPVAPDGGGFIEQQAPAHLAVGLLEAVQVADLGLTAFPADIIAVIVVAQDGIHPITGLDLA